MDECGVNHNCNEAAASEDHSGTECPRPPGLPWMAPDLESVKFAKRIRICKIYQHQTDLNFV
jgi:hypothetical protein